MSGKEETQDQSKKSENKTGNAVKKQDAKQTDNQKQKSGSLKSWLYNKIRWDCISKEAFCLTLFFQFKQIN